MDKRLMTKANLADPDGFYSALIAALEGMSEEETASFNARLILILANQIGDDDILTAALSAARGVAQTEADVETLDDAGN